MTSEESEKIAAASKLLSRYCIEAGFVIPTETGMHKSIMDATWPLREYFMRTGFHDYSQQAQGSESKRVVPIKIIEGSSIISGEMSVYRPETKQGDPRLWIYSLSKHAAAGEVIALTFYRGELFIFNCSRENIEKYLVDKSTPLGDMAYHLDINAAAAEELLKKLKEIGSKGFIPSMKSGDTGIGFTLETLLGIKANSNCDPDYHGIEIKSARKRNDTATARGRHVTLFSKVPAWAKSPYTARKSLETFGYRDEESKRLQLFCSIDAVKANSLGFKLEPRPEDDCLVNINLKRVEGGEDVFLWMMNEIAKSFSEKHQESFWVAANTKRISGLEHFEYAEVRHTRKPSISSFDRLISTGGICVDLTMSEKGKSAVRDHGYLFRVYGSSFDELFPTVGIYSLLK